MAVEVIVLGSMVLASIGLSISAYVRVHRAPDNTSLRTLIDQALVQVEAVTSHANQTRRDFRTLESDVEHLLEQATTRLRRAAARENNTKRAQNNQAQQQRTPTLEEQFEAAERSLADEWQ